MGGRMVWAAVLGGVVLFMWGFVAHMLLGLSEAHVREPSGERASATAWLHQSSPEHGVLITPMPPSDTSEPAQLAYEARVKSEPYAFIVVQPAGMPEGVQLPQHLVREVGICIVMALIAVFLIAVAGGLSGPVSRILFCVLLAGFGFLQTDARYLVWYHFPVGWTVAQLIEKLVGGALLGLVIHLVLGKRR